jgi:formate dehydrogenase assembly factor FdhD
LLPKVDVMVTNGGYGGVQRAVSTGVPLVVAGSTEDELEVAFAQRDGIAEIAALVDEVISARRPHSGTQPSHL